nr:MAG TPA: hypothetical protein [Caudoviricetes sp.]
MTYGATERQKDRALPGQIHERRRQEEGAVHRKLLQDQ